MISYSQVGVCKAYATQTGDAVKAKPDEAFAIFKIETIDNSKQDSPLNLDPERFYVNQTPEAMEQKNISFRSRRFMTPDPRFAQAMGVKSLARGAFPANQTSEVNSYIIVPLKLDNPSGGPEANQYSFDLTYDTTTSEEQTGSNDIIAKKTDPASTKYSVTENCKELAYK
ncbi:MAG: hypothetical protein ACT4O2_12415 [Beijerinckiaceae bacterium]